MDTGRNLDPGRQSALVGFILMAFIALGYALEHGAPLQATPVPEPAANPAEQPAKRLQFPLAGFEHALRDNFDERRGLRAHEALDIMAPRGTPILAVDDGRIAKLYRGPLAGIAVYQFDPATTRVYFYAHLDRYAPGLAEGEPVKRGQVIGYVGSTGNATRNAPHLHFSLRALGEDKRWWKGRAVNPYEPLRDAAASACGSTPAAADSAGRCRPAPGRGSARR